MNIINYIEHLNAISIQSISNIIYMYQSLDSSIYFFKRSVNENNETLSGFFLSRTSTLKLLQSYGDNTLNIEIKVGFQDIWCKFLFSIGCNETIKNLNLSWNHIRGRGAQAIGLGLQVICLSIQVAFSTEHLCEELFKLRQNKVERYCFKIKYKILIENKQRTLVSVRNKLVVCFAL